MKGKPERPTIGDVAAKARVAPTTVSRVLNGGYVSAEVRSRVEKVIKTLGYVPSPTARSLKYGRKGCIGVVVESVHGPWFMGLLAGMEEELTKRRISVLLGGLMAHGRYDSSTVQSWITERRIDGLVFARYTRRERDLLSAARQAQIPMTFICPDETGDLGFVARCRNFEAGRTIGEHLLELGHRRIAFVGGPETSIDAQDRLRGLRAAVEEAGASVRADDVTFGPTYEAEAGAGAAREYLRRAAGNRPTASVLGNDAMAIGFMRELLKAGVRIPEEHSVTGFDGVDEGARFWPGLTTAQQPMEQLGRVAVAALLDRVDDPESDVGMTVEYPMPLARRESTGPATGSGAKKPRSVSA
ncbi:MAG: LacI family transcriptional regulator [Myxococcales bacterium]|nr:MAG: LacI family transcriptional regulator [Myxococcales bacterium]